MRISDWSSDVCSSDLQARRKLLETRHRTGDEIHTRGRTSLRTVRLEMALSDHLALALNDASPLASIETLREAGLANNLTPEQRTALLHLGDRKSTRLNSSH